MVNRRRTNRTKRRRPRNGDRSLTVQRMPRPKVNFDGQVLNTQLFVGNLNTITTTGNAMQIIMLDCGSTYTNNTNPVAAGIGFPAITGFYEQYRITSVTAQWVPAVSPNSAAATARVYIFANTNPENMNAMINAYTNANLITSALLDRSMKVFNPWEHVTYNFPMMNRHKWFDVNSTIAVNDPNVLDRSTQAVLVTVSDGGPTSGATALGSWIIRANVQLRGLNGVST